MARVFISFVHEDEKVAESVQRYITEQLKLTGDVFLSSDQWQVFAGEVWLDRIKGELTEAEVVILMLSKRSVDRPWVNFEAGAAWLRDKPIVPVCYGNMTKGSLPKPYSGIQALDLPSEKYYMVCSVAHHLGIMAPPPEGLKAVADLISNEPESVHAKIGRFLNLNIRDAIASFKDVD